MCGGSNDPAMKMSAFNGVVDDATKNIERFSREALFLCHRLNCRYRPESIA